MSEEFCDRCKECGFPEATEADMARALREEEETGSASAAPWELALCWAGWGNNHGQPTAAAPQAPLDPKVGQMSEDAKAFGPAAQPSELREALRGLLAWADSDEVGGAFAMAWVHGYRISDEFNKKAKAAGDAARAALRGTASANAEGAQAIEIARAEGKAEGLEAAARLVWDHPASNEYGSPCAELAHAIRSLIPAAPGGGGK